MRLLSMLSAALGIALLCPALLTAQQGSPHYFHSADLPPGVVGRGQALRGGPTPGYFQPVEIRGPKGTLLSPAVNGAFVEGKSESLLAGMLIGGVYRFKVSRIPDQETDEVFPTVEVISRLHPPPGQALRFPIPIELTLEELGLAIQGRFVTRVIYLEDPHRALPIRQDANSPQPYFEAPAAQDALRLADELGRPMAILRMGSRVPDLTRETTNLGIDFGTPPILLFDKPAAVSRNAGLEEPAFAPHPTRVATPPQTPGRRR
jgi:hypothetical protein